MMRAALFIVLGVLTACTAAAAQRFSCGGADVDIRIVPRESATWELRYEAVVSVSKEGYSTVLRYRGDIDFIGGTCVDKAGSAPLVVYQAYCGGSGCKDGANWGVIDSHRLRVLAVPSDSNRNEAAMIVGDQPLPQLKMMNVLKEARTMGVQVP